jgi:hypothetical protein
MSIQPESVFTFPRKHPFIRKIADCIAGRQWANGILTLKSRVLSPPRNSSLTAPAKSTSHGRKEQVAEHGGHRGPV